MFSSSLQIKCFYFFYIAKLHKNGLVCFHSCVKILYIRCFEIGDVIVKMWNNTSNKVLIFKFLFLDNLRLLVAFMNRRTSSTWNWVYFWSALPLAQASLCVRSVDLYGFAGKTTAVLQTIARPKKVNLGYLVHLDLSDRLDHPGPLGNLAKKGLTEWQENLVQLKKSKPLNTKYEFW